MSASEKLKALETGLTAGEWTANDAERFIPSLTVGGRHKFTGRMRTEADAQFCAAMANALPQIVAVMNAAERLDDEYEKWRTDANDGTYALWSEHSLQDALYASRLALAALEEALS